MLFARSGSLVADETVAVFVRVAADPGAVTTAVIGGAAVPVARVARVHVTDTFPTFEHVHPVPDADRNVTPTGNVSVTDTAVASDGPPLATARV